MELLRRTYRNYEITSVDDTYYTEKHLYQSLHILVHNITKHYYKMCKTCATAQPNLLCSSNRYYVREMLVITKSSSKVNAVSCKTDAFFTTKNVSHYVCYTELSIKHLNRQ